jgi:hypothetical protein
MRPWGIPPALTTPRGNPSDAMTLCPSSAVDFAFP